MDEDAKINISADTADTTVCSECLETNLIEKVVFNKCFNCKTIYCVHTAASTDPAYCATCIRDVSITIIPLRGKDLEIKFNGASWLFVSRKIKILTDDELQMAIEYHWAVMSSMLREREERRREAFRKSVVRNVNFIPAPTKTDAEIKKLKNKVKKEKKNDLTKILQDLLKHGMTKEQIIALAGSK